MHTGSRAFALLFSCLVGASFFATTLILAWEFWDEGTWVDFLAIDSHLFVFFPAFGVIALVAFYLPAAAFFDLYWHRLRWGKMRFVLGFSLAVAASWALASAILSSANKPIWDIPQQTLASDRGMPAGCAEGGGNSCTRLPLLGALGNLRTVSQSRQSIRPFIRQCVKDPLIDRAARKGPDRFCLAATPMSGTPVLLDDASCCKAQDALIRAIGEMSDDRPARDFVSVLKSPLRIFERLNGHAGTSLTGDVHALLLPLKGLFFLTLLGISFFLTMHFDELQEFYAEYLPGIEAGVLIGTFAVLFFPLMSQAFLLANEALVGVAGLGFFSQIVPFLSLAFGMWTLLIMLFFFRGRNKETEIAGKILGAALGVVTLIQYEAIVGFLVRAIGAGADETGLVAIGLVGVGLALFARWATKRAKRPTIV